MRKVFSEIGVVLLVAVFVLAMVVIIGNWKPDEKVSRKAEVTAEANDDEKAEAMLALERRREELLEQYRKDIDEIVNGYSETVEENVRILNSFNDRLSEVTEIEDDEERERVIDEVLNGLKRFVNGLSGENGNE